MKTIEEQAKAYNTALEMAREAFYSPETPHFAKAWLLTMFPTIAENKDEKIRKALYADIRTYIPNERGDRYIAWLEKQGHMLDPDKVIAWIDDQACQGWIEDVEVDKFVDKFKQDFGL